MVSFEKDRPDMTQSQIKMQIWDRPPIVGCTEDQIKDGKTNRRERRKRERCKIKR